MKVVADNRIPYIKGILEPFAEVDYLEGACINRESVIDADALIVRTRTRIDKNLLRDTRVKFVGSATIGTDHIDTIWCRENGIYYTSAPGCNAGSVMQYIAASLAVLQNEYNIEPGKTTLGIIGVGNIGKKVASMAATLGYKVLLNDPPRQRTEGTEIFSSFEELINKSDIISLHVPLSTDGQDKTYHLMDSAVFDMAKDGVIVINTSRGGVIKEQHLTNNLKTGKVKAAILDVWEGEPKINRELLDRTLIATPHIAGYSVDGKINGSMTILKEFCNFFQIPLELKQPESLPIPGNNNIVLEDTNLPDSFIAGTAILKTFPIMEDHRLLISSPRDFEALRNTYRIRREFHAYKVSGRNNEVLSILEQIGFIRNHK